MPVKRTWNVQPRILVDKTRHRHKGVRRQIGRLHLEAANLDDGVF